MVTLEEVESVWGNSSFGPKLNANKIDVVKYALLKCASGYYQGHTSRQIATELGLLTKDYELTKRGQYCLYEFFRGDSTL